MRKPRLTDNRISGINMASAFATLSLCAVVGTACFGIGVAQLGNLARAGLTSINIDTRAIARSFDESIEDESVWQEDSFDDYDVAADMEIDEEEHARLMAMLDGTYEESSEDTRNNLVSDNSESNNISTKRASSPNSTSKKTEDAIVYWVPNGEVYHSTSNCSTLSRSSVINNGTNPPSDRRPCKVCY